MYGKFARALRHLQRCQRGITGLETAIILIAFVTVASVLAYSVLTAGIFSAERGKETVYKGLEQAEGGLEVASVVLGLSTNQTKLDAVQFFICLVIPNEVVDTNAIVVNYWDKEIHAEGCSVTLEIGSDSIERGTASMLENDELFKVTVTVPASANVVAYETFTVELLPPVGNAVTLTRSLPGSLLKVMDLK